MLPRILIFCELHPKNSHGMPKSCSRNSTWLGEVFEHRICGGQDLFEGCGVGLKNRGHQEISRDAEVRVTGCHRCFERAAVSLLMQPIAEHGRTAEIPIRFLPLQT